MTETKTFEELFLSQSEEENLKINHLKILIINNINGNHMYLIKLKEWQNEQQQYFDYLIILGNFLSFNENKKKDDIKDIANDEAEIGGLLSYLENVSLNIIYIGGNNDVTTIFKAPYPKLTLRSINLHKKFHKLADDLYLIGYGGWAPMEKLNNPIENTFLSLDSYIKDNDKISNIQTIFINNESSYEKNIISNSNKGTIYEDIIKAKRNKIFINLNGNIKSKKGTQKLCNTTTINPGSICEGELVILIIERDTKDNSWKIQKIDFLNI